MKLCGAGYGYGWGLAFVLVLTAGPGTANAASIWSNSACFCSGGTHLQKFDLDTGALLQEWIAPTDQPNQNGRGVVLIDDVLYYTVVNDPKIYKLDAITGAFLGSITTSIQSMSTIGWDGEAFWTSDYTGNNNAYRIDTSGNTIDTVQLPNSGNFYDGLEWFNGKLIANSGDPTGPYHVYDLDGNVLQAAFLNAGSSHAGIAFDGTNFYTSNIFTQSLDIYDGTTGAFIKNLALQGNSFTLIEDLSFDYADRPDTGNTTTTTTDTTTTSGSVPEPTSMALFGIGLGASAYASRRRHKKNR